MQGSGDISLSPETAKGYPMSHIHSCSLVEELLYFNLISNVFPVCLLLHNAFPLKVFTLNNF